METLTIGQACGRRVQMHPEKYMFLERYDPFTRTWTGNGYSDGPVVKQITCTQLREFGIEIVPSVEELEKIEALRLSNRVKRAATELGAAITEWLENPAAR